MSSNLNKKKEREYLLDLYLLKAKEMDLDMDLLSFEVLNHMKIDDFTPKRILFLKLLKENDISLLTISKRYDEKNKFKKNQKESIKESKEDKKYNEKDVKEVYLLAVKDNVDLELISFEIKNNLDVGVYDLKMKNILEKMEIINVNFKELIYFHDKINNKSENKRKLKND